MITRTFYYQGAAKHFGKFGLLATGDQVLVTDSVTAEAIDRDVANWFEAPTVKDSKIDAGAGFQTKTGDYTALLTDRMVKVNHSAAAAITLPAAPSAKQIVEIVDISAAGAAANVITIARNGKTIDGAAANLTIDTDGGSKRLFYDGLGWRTF